MVGGVKWCEFFVAHSFSSTSFQIFMHQTYLIHTVITSGIAPLFYILAMSEEVRHKIDDKIYDIKEWVVNRWKNSVRRGGTMVEDEEIALETLNTEEDRNMVHVEEIALETPNIEEGGNMVHVEERVQEIIEEQSLSIRRTVFQNDEQRFTVEVLPNQVEEV